METVAAATSNVAADPVRVLIVSDIRLHRECLADGLKLFSGLRVVAQAANAAEALTLATSTLPEVILLDVGTERSLEIARSLHRDAAFAKIIALGVHDVAHDVVACAEAGVTGCFPCDGSLADFAATIVATRREEVGCSPRAATALFKHVASLARAVTAQCTLLPLTGREIQVVALIDRGCRTRKSPSSSTSKWQQ